MLEKKKTLKKLTQKCNGFSYVIAVEAATKGVSIKVNTEHGSVNHCL